jgi:hypothetical protein
MVTVFVLKLLAGITLMWLLMPRKDVTDGFFRIQMLVVLGLSVLAVLTADTSLFVRASSAEFDGNERIRQAVTSFRIGWIVSAVTAYVGHIVWKLSRRGPGRVAIGVLGLLNLALLGARVWMMESKVFWGVQLVSDLASSAVLGATLTGMLLGHWYLTTPTMSIQPLNWFAKALLASGVVRLVVSLILLRSGWPAADLTQTLWLGVRLAGGVFVPIAAAVMIMRILKYRNTQSATGVLFAALILVFMAEMSAALLENDLGRPV